MVKYNMGLHGKYLIYIDKWNIIIRAIELIILRGLLLIRFSV